MDDPGGVTGQPHESGLAAVHRFPWIDSSSFPIAADLDRVAATIEACRAAHGHVLIHCYHGKSRSAAAVAAWLIRYRGMDADAAHALLRRCRSIVQINDGFMAQLREYRASVVATTPAPSGSMDGAVVAASGGSGGPAMTASSAFGGGGATSATVGAATATTAAAMTDT